MSFFLLFCVVTAATCLLLACPVHTNQIEYCDKKASYQVTVKGVEINPNPIARGQPATFKISAITGGDINKGKLVIDVKYFGMHIHQETLDLCKETSCPVSTGDFRLSHQQTLPSFTPPGSYTLIMKILGEEDKQLTCFNFDFSIGFTEPDWILVY
ncbi:phosphatidylglycerol/phosphatidylinositol transfer protein-like [Musa acuminata AAA Group]|uniref:phosphatidylglycerol/phosphatidylinositol transfer protein-like n=1 Tax=Musa acuminata AAA Group TaxID=214697 RepID=UPI0031CF5F4F